MDRRRLCFGIFLAPFYPVDENPTLAVEREYVMPRFRGDNAGRRSSMEWSSANRTELMEAGRPAKVVAAQKHEAGLGGRAGA